MALNSSFHYMDGQLWVDSVPLMQIAEQEGTPLYVYSLRRLLANYRRVESAFGGMNAHIHYSAKANANPAVLKALIGAGAGIDAVSAGEIFLALKAGVKPENVVFAGVGKTSAELRFALEQGVGWINAENELECQIINELAGGLGIRARVALRLNPDVTAATHHHISTGHSAAKFGLSEDVVKSILDQQAAFAHIDFAGLHVHIGSQLGETGSTLRAVERVLSLAQAYEGIRTIDIGGGFPAAYITGQETVAVTAFADALRDMLAGYEVIVEPGRSIIADAGVLLTKLLYVKQQSGHNFYVVDASMTELIRPALYDAVHEIVPLKQGPEGDAAIVAQVVGPVCETADILGRDMRLPALKVGDTLGILTAGAYGSVMASNYNARPRPAELVVDESGKTWSLSRRRESLEDLIARDL